MTSLSENQESKPRMEVRCSRAPHTQDGRLCEVDKRICLSLTEGYAPMWKTWEGVRELIQNWRDGLQQTLLDKLEELVQDEDSAMEMMKAIKIDTRCDRKEIDKASGQVYIFTASAALPASPEDAQDPGGKRVRANLGTAEYSSEQKQLSLVNHNTELTRQVLLMGYTSKAKQEDYMIGKFGEGLKVGALALVRAGYAVSVETSNDIWSFSLVGHDKFDSERLLTVDVFMRPAHTKLAGTYTELSSDATLTILQGLTMDEWTAYSKRFLFLNMSSRYREVKTDHGSLLLEDVYSGQLFVKNIWVTDDFKEEGLVTGVNLRSMPMDRDRRAMVGRNFVEHQVNRMWADALQKEPALVERYYTLLASNRMCEVRYADVYLKEEVNNAVADRFVALHGESAIPVLPTLESEEVRRVARELNKTIVHCNQSLYRVLEKSARFPSVSDMMQQAMTRTKKPRPLPELTPGQKKMLAEAVELVKSVVPDFSGHMVEVVHTDGERLMQGKAKKRIGVPITLFDKSYMHRRFRLCNNPHSNCKCCEMQLCRWFLQYLAKNRSLLPGPAVAEDLDDQNFLLLKGLAMRTCTRFGPLCGGVRTSDMSAKATHQLCDERVERLEAAHQLVVRVANEQAARFREDLTQVDLQGDELQRQLKQAEKEQKIEIEEDGDDDEEYFREQYELAMHREQLRADYKKNELVQMNRQVVYLKEKIEEQRRDAARQEEELYRAIDSLRETQQRYRKHLALCTDEVCQLRDNLKMADDENVLSIVQSFVDRLDEFDSTGIEKCNVCRKHPRDTFFSPCSHQIFCEDCARRVKEEQRRCPYCQIEIDTFSKTFLS